jgi:hypothetical protein
MVASPFTPTAESLTGNTWTGKPTAGGLTPQQLQDIIEAQLKGAASPNKQQPPVANWMGAVGGILEEFGHQRLLQKALQLQREQREGAASGKIVPDEISGGSEGDNQPTLPAAHDAIPGMAARQPGVGTDYNPIPPDQTKPMAAPNAAPQNTAAPDVNDRSIPASIRNNNPGAMWSGPSATKFGATSFQNLPRGQQIATFPDPVSGAAAQFDLLNTKYAGKSVRDLVARWSGGNNVDEYARVIAQRAGLTPNTVVTSEMLRNPNIAKPFAQAMAYHEAGRQYPLSDAQWLEAHSRAFGDKALPVTAGVGQTQGQTASDVLPPTQTAAPTAALTPPNNPLPQQNPTAASQAPPPGSFADRFSPADNSAMQQMTPAQFAAQALGGQQGGAAQPVAPLPFKPPTPSPPLGPQGATNPTGQPSLAASEVAPKPVQTAAAGPIDLPTQAAPEAENAPQATTSPPTGNQQVAQVQDKPPTEIIRSTPAARRDALAEEAEIQRLKRLGDPFNEVAGREKALRDLVQKKTQNINGWEYYGNNIVGFEPTGRKAQLEYKEIGKDPFGNPAYGFIDPSTRQVYPAKVAGTGGTGQGDLNNVNWDEPDADKFLKQFPAPIQSQVHAYVEGRQMPTGNPRSGNVQQVKMVAQAYGDKTGMAADDTTYNARKTMRNNLSLGTPGSLGGQITNGNTAIGHLADLAESAAKLDNADWGFSPLSHAINATRNMFGDKSPIVQEMKDTALKYGQEITKFYAGSGGGVEERTRFEQAVSNANTPKELAAVLSREAQLMQSKLGGLEVSIRQTLGDAFLKDHPIVREDSKKALNRLEDSISKLNGFGGKNDTSTGNATNQPNVTPPKNLVPPAPPSGGPPVPPSMGTGGGAPPPQPPAPAAPPPQPAQPSPQSLMRGTINRIGPTPAELAQERLMKGAHEPTPAEMSVGAGATLGAPFMGLPIGKGAPLAGRAAVGAGKYGVDQLKYWGPGALMFEMIQNMLKGGK